MSNSPEVKPNSGRKLFFGLFIFPLLIAVGMAVLLCTVVLLTNEQETPESLITAIKTGSPSKRWQKAFELSNELNRQKKGLRTEGLEKEMIHILGDPSRYDAKTRGYIAIALGHFKTSNTREALTKALSDESEDVRLYALWSLGTLGAVEAIPAIRPFMRSEKEDLRKTAAYVLGAIGDPAATQDLLPLLDDKAQDVQWNAALALSRLGNNAGLPTLMKMLERSVLESAGMDEAQVERVMINAIKGISRVGNEKSFEILRTLSRQDKSLKVRQAAMDALELKSY